MVAIIGIFGDKNKSITNVDVIIKLNNNANQNEDRFKRPLTLK